MMLADILAGWLIGLQLVSAHYGSGADQLQWATPGIYAVHPSCFTASVYRNSEGRASVLAGWTWQSESRTWAITAGIVTGYSMGSVLPLVVPSVRIPMGDTGVALRLSAVPPIAKQHIVGALTLALETEF